MNPNQIQKLEETFIQIMDKFDFSKVRALMLINGWKWAGFPDIPSEGQMRSTCSQLFKGLVDELQRTGGDHGSAKAGGFQLLFFTWDNGAMELELTFNWESVCYGVERV